MGVKLQYISTRLHEVTCQKTATFMSNIRPSFQNSISALIFLTHFIFFNLGIIIPVFTVTWQLRGTYLNKAAYMKLAVLLWWPCLWSDRLTDNSLRPTNGGWIPGREKKFIYSPKSPGRIWRPPSLLFSASRKRRDWVVNMTTYPIYWPG
jgi:hypothetical protein